MKKWKVSIVFFNEEVWNELSTNEHYPSWSPWSKGEIITITNSYLVHPFHAVFIKSSLQIWRHLFLGRKAMTNLDSILKSRHYFADKSPYSPSYGFSHSPVRMGELDHKEGWMLMHLNCGVGEDSWESLGLQGDQTSQS